MSSKKIKIMVTAAFFVALDIIVARLLGFEVPFPTGPIKFDFQIIVAAIAGYVLGPWWACITLVASDLLGVMMNAGTLGMFFGFTISAALRGIILGYLLHNRTLSPIRIASSVGITYLMVDLLLNTFWLSFLVHAPFLPSLAFRALPKGIFMVVLSCLSIVLIKLFEVAKQKRA